MWTEKGVEVENKRRGEPEGRCRMKHRGGESEDEGSIITGAIGGGEQRWGGDKKEDIKVG